MKKASESNTKGKSKEEAWKNMPKEAIEFVRSLPEFNAEIFYEITGIKIEK